MQERHAALEERLHRRIARGREMDLAKLWVVMRQGGQRRGKQRGGKDQPESESHGASSPWKWSGIVVQAR